MTDSAADNQAQPNPDHRVRDDEPQLELRRDVLTLDLRERAVEQGRDPEEVDPLSDDEDALRRASLGGTTRLR